MVKRNGIPPPRDAGRIIKEGIERLERLERFERERSDWVTKL